MADGFRIPFQEAESEFVEKRSRFISHVWRVETEEEAQAQRVEAVIEEAAQEGECETLT